MTTTVKPEDLACSSAACDYLKDCNGQITGSHLARVAQLFADARVKAECGEIESSDNPSLHLKMEPSPGTDIGDCYDHAAQLVRKLGCVVNFDFNGVFCGVRPFDILGESRKEHFIQVYHFECAKTTGCKICYAN